MTHACEPTYSLTACGVRMVDRWSGELDDDHPVTCRRCIKALAALKGK